MRPKGAEGPVRLEEAADHVELRQALWRFIRRLNRDGHTIVLNDLAGLHRRAGLRRGETLLVHAAAGGVGSAAIQLGKSAGARVIAVAGGAGPLPAGGQGVGRRREPRP